MKIAVVGAGAIGAYWGAAMQRGGAEVHLIARNDHLRAMRKNGVRVLSSRGMPRKTQPRSGPLTTFSSG